MSVEQDQADFLSGYHGDEAPAQAEATTEIQEGAKATEGDEVKSEETILAGLTEAQIKTLLERSARVDTLEEQIRKAHGKIGEMNGYLQELRAPKAPTHQAPVLDNAELAALEDDYPELAKLINARAQQAAADAFKGQADPNALRDEITSEVRREMEMRLMDIAHPDWQDVLQQQDFSLWLATQPDEVRQTYAETESAKKLAPILGEYKAWQANAAGKSHRNKQRLEASLTPSGSAARTTPSKTDEDEFRAGFYGT